MTAPRIDWTTTDGCPRCAEARALGETDRDLHTAWHGLAAATLTALRVPELVELVDRLVPPRRHEDRLLAAAWVDEFTEEHDWQAARVRAALAGFTTPPTAMPRARAGGALGYLGFLGFRIVENPLVGPGRYVVLPGGVLVVDDAVRFELRVAADRERLAARAAYDRLLLATFPRHLLDGCGYGLAAERTPPW